MCNLALLRANDIGYQMKLALNTRYYQYASQNTIEEFCGNNILQIPLRYNESIVTGWTDNPAIMHFVGLNKFGYGLNAERRHVYDSYRAMTWEEVSELRKERYGRSLTF